MKKPKLEDTKSNLHKNIQTENGRGTIAAEVVQNLRVILRTTQAHSRWIEKSTGVSGAQLWAMWELFATPGQKVSELSRTLSIHQSTASNMLDKLEEKGLIRRQRGGPDQRVVQLFLTSKGVELLSDAPRPAQGAIIDALTSLPDTELCKLNEGLSALLIHMKVAEQNAAMKPLA